jgi:hypothetical protein
MEIAHNNGRRRIYKLSLAIVIILMLNVFGVSSLVRSSVPDVSATVTDTNIKYSLGMKGNQILYNNGFWYLFYFNGSNTVCSDGAILYRVSADGGNWSDPRIAVDNLYVSAYFSVYTFNDTVVVAYSTMPPEDSFFNSVVLTRKGTFSSLGVTWNDPMMLFGGPEIGRTVGSIWGDYCFGQHWLAVEFLEGGGSYNCEIFSTVDFTSWSLSKYWHTWTGGYVFTITLKYVENSRLMALYGSWGSTEFNYMFFDGSTWSEETATEGASLSSACYKAQCEVVVKGTLYMLYSTWDYITALRLAVYNGSWYFSDFLPETRYWGGDSSAALDNETGTAYFFYVDAFTNEVLSAYSANLVDWTKNVKVAEIQFDSPRYTRTTRISEGKIAVAWSEGETRPFHVEFVTVATPTSTTPDLESPALTFSTDSSPAFIGYKFRMDGSLTDANGTGISGADLALSYSVTDGETWNVITSVATVDGGQYIAEWMPAATGNYLLRLSYDGNATIGLRGTAVYSTLAVIPAEENCVFSVVSNSTISDLTFNSTDETLSFMVSGPSGTTGYSEVIIGKALVDDINELNVSLDKNPANYSVTSTDTTYTVHLTYSHSTHKIAITLGAAPFNQPSLTTPLSLGILAVILAIATAKIILKKSPKLDTASSARVEGFCVFLDR